MTDKFAELIDDHIEFIKQQQMFFVATAGGEGLINLSPKGIDSFRVIDKGKVMWLNLTGSGNESAAHVLENGRMTVMFCSFEKRPLILRLYGQAKIIHPYNEQWPSLTALFPPYPGSRQIFDLDLTLVQTSCGYGVPYYQWQGERETLEKWADKKGEEGLKQYWQEKNSTSLDGKRTGIIE